MREARAAGPMHTELSWSPRASVPVSVPSGSVDCVFVSSPVALLPPLWAFCIMNPPPLCSVGGRGAARLALCSARPAFVPELFFPRSVARPWLSMSPGGCVLICAVLPTHRLAAPSAGGVCSATRRRPGLPQRVKLLYALSCCGYCLRSFWLLLQCLSPRVWRLKGAHHISACC